MYDIILRKRAFNKVRSFYLNVSKRYKHTNPREDVKHQVREVIDSIQDINKRVSHRTPTISRWQRDGWLMINTRSRGKVWYFAYTIKGDTAYVMDACHSQNMHETIYREGDSIDENIKDTIVHIITESVIQKIRQLVG